MVTEIEACSREAVNSLLSESDESGTEDTPAKKRRTEYKVLFIFSWCYRGCYLQDRFTESMKYGLPEAVKSLKAAHANLISYRPLYGNDRVKHFLLALIHYSHLGNEKVCNVVIVSTYVKTEPVKVQFFFSLFISLCINCSILGLVLFL